VLTVAVSVSSGIQNAASALPFITGHEPLYATVVVLVLMALNLRGVRESGTFFAVPTYGFMLGVIGMAVYGGLRYAFGDLPQVESADLKIIPDPDYSGSVGTAAMIFLLARAFSSGCAALTGVEAISNGVPAFRKPKSRNAATTLLLLGSIAITMLLSIVVLARQMGLKYVDPFEIDRLRHTDGSPMRPGYDEHTVIAQIAKAVFDNFTPGFYFLVAMTGIILVLAANTAFHGFPVLGSILARDGFMPRQLGSRGDRLAYSNGIVILALMAIALIIAFQAQPTRLIQLYIVGVFVSFNLSQLGMIRHWTRHLRTETNPAARRRMFRSRAINTFGLAMTAVVFVVVLLTKFLAGAWIAILAMVVFFAMMKGIRRHYDRVEQELLIGDTDQVLPTRVHAIVLVSKLHKPTMRALAYAKASRPNLLEGVYVGIDPADTDALLEEWEAQRIDVPLKVLHSPYREIVRPIVEYAVAIRKANPRGVVAVYIPEYVVGRWWEQLLHNQTALRLKGRLLFTPGVMVTSVPYQLLGYEAGRRREERRVQRLRPGDVRRGRVREPT
jgi:amino acid transporter